MIFIIGFILSCVALVAGTAGAYWAGYRLSSGQVWVGLLAGAVFSYGYIMSYPIIRTLFVS